MKIDVRYICVDMHAILSMEKQTLVSSSRQGAREATPKICSCWIVSEVESVLPSDGDSDQR
jgi:hypothetical protein